MTHLFDASVAAAGRRLERAAARDGARGIGIATRLDGAVRELVTIVGTPVPPEALADHPGWDLPLAVADRVDTSSGPRTFVAELLPVGVPSTWLPDAQKPSGALSPFALELTRRMVAEHAGGGLVGRLHPATVLVDPDTKTLVAVAQRPLRIADIAAVEGDRPLLGYRTLAPGDLAGQASRADDVFRLGVLLWQWRHGNHPFGNLPDGELLGALAGVDAAVAPATPDPTDDLDRTLVACFAPTPEARPSASEVLAALEATDGG